MNFREVGVKAALEAGKIMRNSFGKSQKVLLKGPRDIVTKTDEDSQRKAIGIINRHFPSHGIIAEENLDKKGLLYRWHIDPIDGTKNFFHNLPYFCISIALEKSGEIVLGVIYDPIAKDLFVAEKGKGATLDGKRIRVRKEKNLPRAMVFYDSALHRDTKFKIHCLSSLAKKVLTIRLLGSVALDLANVSRGIGDAAIFHTPGGSWDISAGCLLVEEAGGKVTDWQGNRWHPNMKSFVASNGSIHSKLLGILKKI
ncbi:MAG TPA: inositol monophosphatase family protein [Candidatus Nanoarchaeia archaeon]|nr:inositol monophosphatase family protein [Candidatus Nanoarchaeia archaeon]